MNFISPKMARNGGRLILKVGKYVYSGKMDVPLGIPSKTLSIHF